MPDVSGASAVNTGVHTYYPPARTRLRVHWAPGIPRALCFQRAKDFWHSSGATRGETMNACLRNLLRLSSPGCIGLHRATQYSKAPVLSREAAAYWIPAFAGMTASSEQANVGKQ